MRLHGTEETTRITQRRTVKQPLINQQRPASETTLNSRQPLPVSAIWANGSQPVEIIRSEDLDTVGLDAAEIAGNRGYDHLAALTLGMLQ
jgi:hypothetical protein